MTRRIARVVAWLIAVSMTALWVWVLVAGDFLASMFASLPPEEQRELAAGIYLPVTFAAIAGLAAVTLTYATVGLLLALRPGGGRVGAILLAGSATFGAVPFGYIVGGTLVLRDPLDPFANVLFLLGPASFALAYSMIMPVVALIFPDGHLPSPAWRWLAGAALAALATTTALTVFRPGKIAEFTSTNPLGIDALPAWLSGLAGPLAGFGIVLMSLLGIAAVVTRYRRGSGIERQQLRWFVAAVLLAVVPITVAPLTSGFAGPAWLLLGLFGLLLVPVSIWIAVTRHRLYEIDRLISRGLSWAVLSGLLLAVYAGAVLLLQSVLSGVTQGETVAVAGSTLLAAALFQPLRRRVQAAVDHRFNRARYDAERTATDFAERLRDQIDLGALKGELRMVVGRSLAPTSVGIWMRRSERTADR